jgi:hypothetical protein
MPRVCFFDLNREHETLKLSIRAMNRGKSGVGDLEHFARVEQHRDRIGAAQEHWCRSGDRRWPRGTD